MAQLINQIVHVRFGGRSEELTLAMLNLDSQATDSQIQRAITTYFDLPTHSLDHYVIVRTNNAIIVRPEAIYG